MVCRVQLSCVRTHTDTCTQTERRMDGWTNNNFVTHVWQCNCAHLENNVQDVVEALHLALQQTLLGNCPAQLLLQGQSLPSGPDLLPLQQRQAALGSLVTPPCAHMVIPQQPVGKVETTFQALTGAFQFFDVQLAAAVVYKAGFMAHMVAPPGQCQLLLKT